MHSADRPRGRTYARRHVAGRQRWRLGRGSLAEAAQGTQVIARQPQPLGALVVTVPAGGSKVGAIAVVVLGAVVGILGVQRLHACRSLPHTCVAMWPQDRCPTYVVSSATATARTQWS